MSAVRSSDGEPPRKRVRKGTRSCWECKRRKIRCQLGTEDVPVCSGCLARGTPCLSQEYEYPEDQDTSKGAHVGERLGRVERLLEKLVQKISAYEEEENAQRVMTPESMGNDVLTPFTASVVSTGGQDDAPMMSLFDSTAIGRRQEDPQSQMPTPSSSTSGNRKSCCPRTSKLERTRQALVELLPTQKDVDLICKSSGCWLLVHALASPTKANADGPIFDMADAPNRHPTSIARSILYITLCLQQLDLDFDTAQLNMLPSVESRMEKLISTVGAYITSDDEYASTLAGLECLVLQGLYHVNAGNPRRAWLLFRRALNIGQLMGIHKKDGNNIAGGKPMWYQIVQADRYLALLLGLPAGSADVGFGPEENFQNPEIDKDDLFTRKLCDLSGRIIERNQAGNAATYTATQEISESLDKLSREMPQTWWEVPEYIPNDRSEEAAIHFDRVMTQIWHFQLEALLHMPYMLRAATDRRFEYSKFCCLKASREILWRYLALRKTGIKQFCCKVVDFGALTATVTLFLDLLDSSNQAHNSHQLDEDRRLVHKVLNSMEELSKSGRDVVATQSVNVIKSLQAVDSSSDSHSGGNLKLTIPYFGTINVARPAKSLPTPRSLPQSRNSPFINAPPVPYILPDHDWSTGGPQQQNNGNQMQDASGANMPLVYFTSSQFPALPDQPGPQDWGLTEADTLYFDSLLNTDIEGNWIF